MDWLEMLRGAHAVIDQSVAEGVSRQEGRGLRLACARGCNVCCRSQKDIAVYPIEIAGILWFVNEKAERGLRQRVLESVAKAEPGGGCPFLLDGACSVYEVRPMACRLFNVFTAPCAEGEDPFITRRGDVLTPDEAAKRRALRLTLRYYGISDNEADLMLDMGMLDTQVINLMEYKWGTGGRGPVV